MDFWKEYFERVQLDHALHVIPLSKKGNLALADEVRNNPDAYATTPENKAFLALVRLLDRCREEHTQFEAADEEEFTKRRRRWLYDTYQECQRILQIDPQCTDAKTLALLMADGDGEDLFKRMQLHAISTVTRTNVEDGWSNVCDRPSLRARACTARAMFNTARYSQAQACCEALIRSDPADHLGARYTLALCYARLELEEKLEQLEEQFMHAGNAWFSLARLLLFYKLDRMRAARRALLSFMHTYEAGPFLLFTPIFVDTYLLDRPSFEQQSFEEVAIAIHEAESMLADTPDLVVWAQQHEDFMQQAKKFAQNEGFDD
ncbi:hypothetical protein [Atopobium deltae]|nr:hypothetical protein [Atopobium deltae]